MSKINPKQEKKEHIKEIPIMDEVQELIEKERILLNLKLLDQQKVAEEWKKKYDQLLGNIRDPLVELDSKKPEITTAFTPQSIRTMADFHNIVTQRPYSWILDISGYSSDELSAVLFAKMCKHIFGVRSPFERAINIAWFNNCDLKDGFLPSISFILRSSTLEALDLSKNALTHKFLLDCVPVLKDRSVGPQYLLLAGNISCDEIRVPLAPLIDSLTAETWGLTITLPDFPMTLIPDHHHDALLGKTSKSTLNNDYKELVKQPLKSLEFLEALNDRLQNVSGLPTHFEMTKQKTQKSPGRIKKKKAAIDLLGRNPLHFLSVLGLSFAHLCKQSLETLEITLQLACSSLTELDLSFAYIGFNGAQVLKRTLARAECQLVCLRVMGNSLGDAGSKSVTESLQINKTLTFLDLRSNDISSSGLRTIAFNLRLNPVFHTVDVRNNSRISHESVLAVRRMLKAVGRSPTTVRWSDYAIPSVNPSNDRATSTSCFLFLPDLVRVGTSSRKKTARLYSVELSTLYRNYAESELRSPCLLSWQWRLLAKPHPHVTDSLPGREDRTTSSPPQWEVRVTYNRQSTVINRGALSRSSQLVWAKRALLSDYTDGQNDWTFNSVLVASGLPSRGKLELWILSEANSTVSEKKTKKALQEHEDVSVFEAIDFKIQKLGDEVTFQMGGDSSTLFDDVNAHCSRGSLENIESLSYLQKDGFALERCFRFVLPPLNMSDESGFEGHAAVELEWESKLKLLDDSNGDKKLSAKHRSFGYQWCVVLHSVGGYSQALGDGVVEGLDEEQNSGKEKDVDRDTSLLPAWNWKKHVLRLPEAQHLRPSDQITLSVRVVSVEYSLAQSASEECLVRVKGFRTCLIDVANDHKLYESGHFIAHLNPSSLFAKYNSAECDFPF